MIGGVGALVTGQQLGPRLPLQMGALVPFEVSRGIGGVGAQVTGQRLGPRLPLQMGALVLFEVLSGGRWCRSTRSHWTAA